MASRALSKFKGSMSRVRTAGLSLPKEEKMGKVGHEVVKFGAHAALALASKNLETIGPLPVRPDIAGLAVGLGMMMLKGNKTRGLGKSLATGAAHAVISRWIASDGNITVISGSSFGTAKEVPQQPKVVDADTDEGDD
jgi:hypothetical protein